MLFCLHVEFVFMLMSFNWLTDDLLKDNPPSKFGWSIFCRSNLFVLWKVRKPEKPGNSSSMRRQKSPLFPKLQIFKQNSVKPSRTSTEKFCWKRLSKICVKFCFFLPKKTWFQTKNFYLCMTNTLRRTQNLNLWFQLENTRFEVRDRSSRTSWHAQWLSFCKNTSGWRPWYQERLVLKFPSDCDSVI